ncbi:MAG TPA: hypothetical protein VGP26_28185 [Actinophytocola sp.]|jgi:hypothetical protein|nr:hypothetical protein [Actinophytocola sp.]
MVTVPVDDTLLGIYLNDHLAGATAGVELAERLAGENRDRIGGRVLRRLAEEVAEDRVALLDLMATLDVPVRHYKVWLGWLGEKAGRLKPNGRILTRSPLSRVIGLETLRLGIEGKAALWRALRGRAEIDSRLHTERLDDLLDRARRQSATVESFRGWAVTEAFGGDAEPPDMPAG